VKLDDADASKHVAVLTIYKILLIYIYVVHLLVWVIYCTRCTVHTLKKFFKIFQFVSLECRSVYLRYWRL